MGNLSIRPLLFCLMNTVSRIKKNLDVLNMAKPIGPTPELEGEDAIAVLKKMREPPTEKDKELAKKIREQRFVPF